MSSARPLLPFLSRTGLLPAAALLLGLALTYLLQAGVRQSQQQKLEGEFSFRAGQIVANINDRLRSYEQVLRGAAGLFAASGSVDRRAFRDYVETLKLQGAYPGIQGVGFTMQILPAEKKAHVQAIRAEGFADYDIRPAGERAIYSSIIYLEPFDWRNQRAFGYDMYAEPVRREAMAHARDEGKTAISGKVQLVQETEADAQAGFLMYLPVYRPGVSGRPGSNPTDSLYGWVYAPFRMNDLLQGILGGQFGEISAVLRLSIHDGEQVSPGSLLFDSGTPADGQAPAFATRKVLDLFGHHWTVSIESLPGFDARLQTPMANIVALAGTVISLMLSLVLWLLVSTRSRALAMAEKMTHALQESEALFRAVFDNVVVGIAQASTTGRFLQINDEFCRIIGYTRDEVLSQALTFQQITHPEDLAADLAMLGQLLAGDCERYHLEKRYLHKDGRIVWVSLAVVLVRDEAGEPHYLIGAVQDITSRKRAEGELADYREHLENLVEERTAALHDAELKYRTVADFTYDWETWIDTGGRLAYCSPSCERITGHAPGEFIANPGLLVDIAHPDDRETVREHFLLYKEAHDFEMLTYRIVRPDGSIVWIEHECQPVFDDAQVYIGRRASSRDITERKLAEEALARARDAAEAASRAKSTFLANMSHELRTPMNAIMGMTSLALRHASDAKLIDQLSKVDQASHHLLSVINDILDISKIEAERLSIEHIRFRLGEVLENLISLIGHRVTEKGLKLRVDLTPEVARLSLLGDPLRLGQILINLAGNAVKFTREGTITVRARLLEESETGVCLRIEVQDTGIGIAAADQPRLFNAFEQADDSMTRKYGGTGLGLAITKRLVGMMGGKIGVDSQPGVGSTFWFTVCLEKAAASGTDASSQEATAGSAEMQLKARHAGTRILLAEDEPINQEVSRGLLEDVGCSVDIAEDGVRAVAMARETAYDLILMDMQMPNMSGIDATRAIRALPGRADVPILAMTANAFDDDRQHCLAAGMNDHIGKPVDPARLYEVLLKWLECRLH